MAKTPANQFKQTEIGEIPMDWEISTVGELASISAGGTPSRTNAKYWNGNIPWVTTTEVDFNTITSANQFISEEGLDNSPARILPPNTLLMALYGQGKTRGKVAVLGIRAATNQACAAISIHGKIEHIFLFHFLRSRYEAIRSLSNTGNQENLNSSIVRSILVPLPPLPEQQAIAAALSEADALLTALDEKIAKKRDIKQATMQLLLSGKKRLPGFNGEWRARTLSDMAEIRGGGTPSTSNSAFWDGEIFWCTPTDITALKGCKYLTTTERKITRLGLSASAAEIIPINSVVTTTRATIGECAINLVPVATNQGFKSFIPKSDIDHNFLYYAISAQKKNFLSLCSGSTFLEISKGQLSQYEINVPNGKAEQAAIAEILSDMDAEIAVLEKLRTKQAAIKQGMMQELLTGRTRLV